MYSLEEKGSTKQQTLSSRHPTIIKWPEGFRAALCIRADIETVNCLLRGVPAILRLFDKYGIKATFFVPMGPDCLGRSFNVRNLPRYLRLDPLKKFGLRNLLYGMLLPSPDIGKQYSPELRGIVKQGHEVGLHGFSHADWARSIRQLPDAYAEKLFLKGYNEFTKIFKKKPNSFASPEFMFTKSILSMLDRYNFLYGSDTHGQIPFWPEIGGRIFKTLQIPVTMPNLEELRWRGRSDREALSHVYSELEKKIESGGLAVILIHPSYEGLWKHSLFSTLLKLIDRRRNELWITTMEKVAKWGIENTLRKA